MKSDVVVINDTGAFCAVRIITMINHNDGNSLTTTNNHFNPTNANYRNKPHDHRNACTSAETSYGATRTQITEWKYDWEEWLGIEEDTPGIMKKVAQIIERKGCQCVYEKAYQQRQWDSDNQTPTKITPCVASTHSHVRIPRKSSKWLELFCVNRKLRINDLLSSSSSSSSSR